MSVMLGSGAGTFNVGSQLQQSDGRVMTKTFQWDFTGSGAHKAQWADGMLWSRSRMGGSDAGGILLGNDFQNTGRWDNDQMDILGGGTLKKIIGTTLNSVGSPLASCLVQGFLTVGDIFVGETTSDAGGYYELPTQYVGQAHYLVAYRAGSPDVAGTTVNTIIPV